MYSVKVEERTIQPGKILCVGRNYLEHIKELNNAVPDQMVVFNKPATSIATNLLYFLNSPYQNTAFVQIQVFLPEIVLKPHP